MIFFDSKETLQQDCCGRRCEQDFSKSFWNCAVPNWLFQESSAFSFEFEQRRCVKAFKDEKNPCHSAFPVTGIAKAGRIMEQEQYLAPGIFDPRM